MSPSQVDLILGALLVAAAVAVPRYVPDRRLHELGRVILALGIFFATMAIGQFLETNYLISSVAGLVAGLAGGTFIAPRMGYTPVFSADKEDYKRLFDVLFDWCSKLLFGWLVISVLIALVVSMVTLVMPFIPSLAGWTRGVSFYDILNSVGRLYVLYTGALGLYMGVSLFIDEMSNKRSISEYLPAFGFSVAGMAILITLSIGKLIG